MTADLLVPWLAAFAMTHLVEGPIYALWLRHDHSVPAGLLRSAVLSTTTHPLLWQVFFPLMDALGSYARAVVLAEAVVILAEGALLAWMWPEGGLRRALLAALTANATSTVVGLLRH
jgi:hypothetical protein